jgi:DNA adenine methylase
MSDPRPFVKWAGGKTQLLPLLIQRVPEHFGTYFEPFVGGGSLLFALQPERAVISDINAELINAYMVIRDHLGPLIRSLQHHTNDATHFYDVRTWDVSKLTQVRRASRFIFLNKTCFNGLYRENSAGQFNTPFGRYPNPTVADRANLAAVSEYLRRSEVRLLNDSYEKCVRTARKGDFIYFDPPYFPISATASFTKYHKTDFAADDQRRLAGVFRNLSRRGCYVLLSNSNTPFIRGLYDEFPTVEVAASRAINCRGSLRGKTPNEVLVCSFQGEGRA